MLHRVTAHILGGMRARAGAALFLTLALLLAALAFIPGIASATSDPIVFDAFSVAGLPGPDCSGIQTWNHTTGADANFLIVATIGPGSDSPTVTYAGTGMDYRNTAEFSDVRVTLFTYLNPAAGVHPIVVSDASGNTLGAAMTYTNVTGIADNATTVTYTGFHLPGEISTTMTGGNRSAGFAFGTSVMAYAGDQTERFNETPSPCSGSFWSHGGDTNNETMTWSDYDTVMAAATIRLSGFSPAPPTVTTDSIDHVTSYTARVHGTLTGYGDSTNVAVYADSSPGNTGSVCISNCGPFVSGTDSLPQSFIIAITGLVGDTTFAAWAGAASLDYAIFGNGAHLSFHTFKQVEIVTDPATNVGATKATLNGRILSEDSTPGAVSTMWFEWGVIPYPPEPETTGTGTTTASHYTFHKFLTGLDPTTRAPPTVSYTTGAQTGLAYLAFPLAIAHGNVTVVQIYDPGAVTNSTYYFRFDVSIGGIASTPEFAYERNDLDFPAELLNFTMTAPPAPTAPLNATSVEYYFEYGPTMSFGFETAHSTVTTGTRPVTGTLIGLERNATYYYRLVMIGPDGPHNGTTRSFVTPPRDTVIPPGADLWPLAAFLLGIIAFIAVALWVHRRRTGE